jgi:hypothetical protein
MRISSLWIGDGLLLHFLAGAAGHPKEPSTRFEVLHARLRWMQDAHDEVVHCELYQAERASYRAISQYRMWVIASSICIPSNFSRNCVLAAGASRTLLSLSMRNIPSHDRVIT